MTAMLRGSYCPAHAWCGGVSASVRLLVACALCALCLVACSGQPASFTVRGEALGAYFTITVADPPGNIPASRALEIAEETLDRVNRRMSTYRQDSELSLFNQHGTSEPFPISEETWKVFKVAQTISEQSDGAFDVTVGPLVNAWGFGPNVFENPPTEADIATLLKRVGYRHITLHPDSAIAKAHPELYCDLSGIAKGYAVDAVAEAFEAAGIARYMIEVGGEIRVSGKSPRGTAWALGIETPKINVRDLYAAVYIEHGALATSGDYRNMVEVDGRLVSHTIDPHTGYPAQHALASVSVIHPSCTWADGYATALMALGPEKAESLALDLNLAVLLLVRDSEGNTFRAITTPQFDAYQTKQTQP